MEQLVNSATFAAAVQAQDVTAAANAAAQLLAQQAPCHHCVTQVPAETPRLTHAVSGTLCHHRHHRRVTTIRRHAASSTILTAVDAFKPGDHVVVQLSCPPRPSEARPHEAIVLASPGSNGTLTMQLLRALPAPVPLHKLRIPGAAHHLARPQLDSPSARCAYVVHCSTAHVPSTSCCCRQPCIVSTHLHHAHMHRQQPWTASTAPPTLPARQPP